MEPRLYYTADTSRQELNPPNNNATLYWPWPARKDVKVAKLMENCKAPKKIIQFDFEKWKMCIKIEKILNNKTMLTIVPIPEDMVRHALPIVPDLPTYFLLSSLHSNKTIFKKMGRV
jgi:hypothetical protein